MRWGMMDRWLAAALLSCAQMSLISGCEKDSPPSDDATIPEARSKKQRLAPSAAGSLVTERVHSNSAFAFDLLHAVDPDGNFFFSPHSLSIALAMTYAGAAGTTKDEMKAVLHFDQADADLHAAFNSLDQALASRGQGAEGTKGEPFRLQLSNQLWADKRKKFVPSFLDTLAENYGAGVKLLDFIDDADGSRKIINQWVSVQTEQRIPELLQLGDVNPDTRLVLTNTIYFNAAWLEPFGPQNTSDGNFSRADGSSVIVPFMHGAGQRYAQGSGWKAAEVDYDGGEVAMLVVVPDAGSFADFETGLDAPAIETIASSLKSDRAVSVTFPKLELRTHQNLELVLEKMGMPSAFQWGVADFSAMDGTHDLYIYKVVHEAFMKTDEVGTEAAAATAVVVNVGLNLPPPGSEPFLLDATRPFYLVIRDVPTGAAIFIGRVVDPSLQ